MMVMKNITGDTPFQYDRSNSYHFLGNALVAIFVNCNIVSFLKIAARICQIPENSSGNSPDSTLSAKVGKF